VDLEPVYTAVPVDPYSALKTTDTWRGPAKLQVAARDDLSAVVALLTERIAALERRYARLEEHIHFTKEQIAGVGTVEISGHES
jgi:hypothetical protein